MPMPMLILCKTDAECPEMWNCGNDGHCQSSIINPIGFLPKMDQDYSGSKTEECQTDVECIGEFRCIAGECVNPMISPKPIPDDSRQLSGPKTEECQTDVECPGEFSCYAGECVIINPDDGFVPKMDQDYSGLKTEECQTDVECIGEFRCIAGECVNPMNPKPMPSAIP